MHSSPHALPQAADPGRLFSPLFLGALVLWALNDHVFKGAPWFSSLAAGKLSDLCCLIALPLAAGGAAELVGLRPSAQHAWVVAVALVCAIVMVAINTSSTCAHVYRTWFGVFRWPWDFAAHGSSVPRSVMLTMDPTDVLTVPAAAVAVCVSAARKKEVS